MTSSGPPEFEDAAAAIEQQIARFQQSVQQLREALAAAERKLSFYERFDQEIAQAVRAAQESSRDVRASAQAEALALLERARAESRLNLSLARDVRERCQRIYELAEAARQSAEADAAQIRAHAREEADDIRARAQAEREELLDQAQAERDTLLTAIADLQSRREQARRELEELYTTQLRAIGAERPTEQKEQPTPPPSAPVETHPPQTGHRSSRWLVAVFLFLVAAAAAILFGLQSVSRLFILP